MQQAAHEASEALEKARSDLSALRKEEAEEGAGLAEAQAKCREAQAAVDAAKRAVDEAGAVQRQVAAHEATCAELLREQEDVRKALDAAQHAVETHGTELETAQAPSPAEEAEARKLQLMRERRRLYDTMQRDMQAAAQELGTGIDGVSPALSAASSLLASGAQSLGAGQQAGDDVETLERTLHDVRGEGRRGAGGGLVATAPSPSPHAAQLEGEEVQVAAAGEAGQEALTRLSAGRAALSLVSRIFDARKRLAVRAGSRAGRQGQGRSHPPPAPSPLPQDLDGAFKLLNAELSQKTDTWSAAHGGGAVRDPAAVAKELTASMAELATKKSHLEGQISAVEGEVKRVAADLRRPELAGAEEKSRRALIDKMVVDCTCKARRSGGGWGGMRPQPFSCPPSPALQDLDRYHTALDTALQRYHKLKIDEINLALRSLWASTYQVRAPAACSLACPRLPPHSPPLPPQGEDIDSIEIRSDLDESGTGLGGGAGADGDKKPTRSYNYRVVSEWRRRGRGRRRCC